MISIKGPESDFSSQYYFQFLPLSFQANKTKQNKLMRLIRFMLTVSSGFSKCFKMQMVINLSPVSLSNKKVNIYTCPRLTFLKKNATENAYKSISEPLNFKIFWGSMPPHPPSGSRPLHSKLASSCSEVWPRP